MNILKVENSNKTEKINDLKIFLLCISSGAIGFSLIGALPYEIPLFLRVFIAFLLLGMPLLDFKKIVLFGIAGGLGYFLKYFILWDLFSFKWITAYGIETIYLSLLTGIMIGTFLSVVLWNRKAAEIFPLTGAAAFLLLFNDLAAGLVFGAGMCLYLLSIKKTAFPLRRILLVFAILIFIIFGSIAFIGYLGSMGHPPYAGQTVVSVGEVVEKEGISTAVTNYTFLQNNTGRALKAEILIQNPVDVKPVSMLHLWYRQDEYLGRKIIEKQGRLEATGSNTTSYYLFFENLPEHARTKDFAVVWEVWTGRGIEYVIWRAK